MMYSASELMKATILANDEKCAVREVFFNLEDWQIRWLALDFGGWFEIDEILVSAGLINPPDKSNDSWSMPLGPDALQNAPRWSHDTNLDQLDLGAWPPIIVGPFGGTYAPILLYEQLIARRQVDPSDEVDKRKSEALVSKMDRASEWIGKPAFGRDGELGTVADIQFDSDTFVMEKLIVTEGGVLSKHKAEYSMSTAPHLVDQKTHIVLRATTEDAFVLDGNT